MSLTGSSATAVADRGEIALHYIHDYTTWMKKNWSESVSSAKSAMDQFKAQYTCASVWDDPSYVGRGDTYITLANPGKLRHTTR